MISQSACNTPRSGIPTGATDEPSLLNVVEIVESSLAEGLSPGLFSVTRKGKALTASWSYSGEASVGFRPAVAVHVDQTGRRISSVWHGLTSDEGSLVLTKTELPRRDQTADWKAALEAAVKGTPPRSEYEGLLRELKEGRPRRKEFTSVVFESGLRGWMNWSSCGKLVREYHLENSQKWSYFDVVLAASRVGGIGSGAYNQLEGGHKLLRHVILVAGKMASRKDKEYNVYS